MKEKHPRMRKFALFTRTKHPSIDALKICYEVLAELPEHEREANLRFLVDKFGFWMAPKWDR